jgi:hypothetical protein
MSENQVVLLYPSHVIFMCQYCRRYRRFDINIPLIMSGEW